ncbi:hypothetical protein ACVMB1_000337 [Bradyrhizobium sp. USDA 4504]|nr:hypothetical protein [Bradyrhizobium elkanii]
MLDRLVVFGGRIADGNWTVAAVATPGPPKMQIVILNVHRPCRRQGSLDAEPDDATEATIVEMGFLLRQAAAFKVVDDVASIVLPGYARLEIGKRMPECSKGVTDATGPVAKRLGPALQFALTTKPEGARHVFVPSETAPLTSSSMPNTQLLFCQL